MKKNLRKIFAVILLAAILPMTGGLCFEGLSNPLKIKTAQAAPEKTGMDMAGMTNSSNADMCGEERSVAESENQSDWQTGRANNQRDLLPCCIDSNHTDVVITSAPSFEPNKFMSAAIFAIEAPTPDNLKTFSYRAPIMSPPKLTAIKKTVLRL